MRSFASALARSLLFLAVLRGKLAAREARERRQLGPLGEQRRDGLLPALVVHKANLLASEREGGEKWREGVMISIITAKNNGNER